MSRTLPKRLISILCLPFLLLLLPFLALGIAIIFINATAFGLVKRVRWLRGLRRSGRVVAAAELLSTVNGGTLIVDRPGINFKSTHCWWTSENVTEQSPIPIPTDEERMDLFKITNTIKSHEFDAWCWHRYLSPQSGSATLILPVHHGAAMATVLRERSPSLAVIMSWSAIASMESDADNTTKGE